MSEKYRKLWSRLMRQAWALHDQGRGNYAAAMLARWELWRREKLGMAS